MIKTKSDVRVVSGVLNGQRGAVLKRDGDNIFVQFDDAACWLPIDDVVAEGSAMQLAVDAILSSDSLTVAAAAAEYCVDQAVLVNYIPCAFRRVAKI